MNFGDTNSKNEPRLVFVALTTIISSFLGGLAALVGMLLFGAYPELSETADYSGVSQFLYDWQTLTGSILALSAALITVAVIREQTKSVERQNLSEKIASQRVAMTTLPSALSEIISYTESHWKTLADLARSSVLGYPAALNEKDFPKLGDSTLSNIREVVRYVPPGKEEVIDLVIALARKIQYHEARIRAEFMQNRDLNIPTAEMHLETIAEIFAITTKLFRYFDENYNDCIASNDTVLRAARNLNSGLHTSEGLKLLEKGLARRARKTSN